jgi:ribosomal protection tetracycline resistance protein
VRTLNLGILAHIDAGKTSLTERLLHAAGVIDEMGSVDAGSTRTDTLALERARGITIKSAVVSFPLNGVTVNLIDTPGHPDFIAEVERVLGVLDGVLLVISAVEGVQAQTRVLMRTLQRLRIPTLFFVNKIDRRGADGDRVLRAIGERLTRDAVPLGAIGRPGNPDAAFTPFADTDPAFTDALADRLTAHDTALLAAYLQDEAGVSPGRLRRALAAQSRQGLVNPLFFGSAITGAGVRELLAGVTALLPTADGAAAGDPAGASGSVFKIERGAAGERIAYVRMFAGTLRVRDRVPFGPDGEGRVTGIEVFDGGGRVRAAALPAGRIGRVRGLGGVRIGDRVGAPAPERQAGFFSPPTLESAVAARDPADRGALHLALTELAEQDPLINLRRDQERGQVSVSLYGEVQKEVIQATLAEDYGVQAEFLESTTICVERPAGSGSAAEFIAKAPNPFLATVGLRVDAAPAGSGVRFRLEVELGSMPYTFIRTVEETVLETLAQGLHGWQVIDCTVSLTHDGYWARQSAMYGTFDSSTSSTAGDFRSLTPLVLMDALRQAGTTVLEPVHQFRLEAPADLFGPLLPVLAKHGAVPQSPVLDGSVCVLQGRIPAAAVHGLDRRIPGLTRGEGVLETEFAGYQPVTGAVPGRPRTDFNPLNRKEYLKRVERKA